MIDGLSTSREFAAQPFMAASLPPAPRQRRAVFLAHSSFLSPFRIGSHQLARAFARQGWEVLHVPIPVTPAHVVKAPVSKDYRQRLRRAWKGAVRIERNVHELIPFVWTPWPVARRFGTRAVERYAWGTEGLHRRIERLGFHEPDVLFLDEPRMAGLVAGFKAKVTLYRATDLYQHLKGDDSIVEAERRSLRMAAGFIATSAPVWKHLCRLAPDARGLIVPNGVEFEHFARPRPEPTDLAAIPHPRLVYAGALDDRFDWEVVRRIARDRPDYQLVLIGPRQPASGGRALSMPSNVHALGPRDYEELPGYLQHAAVGLLPLSEHPANAGRSPMKLYEYGAAGLPIVATRTVELERRGLPFVHLFQSEEQAVAMADAAVAAKAVLGPRAVEESQRMSWDNRLTEILEFCRSLEPMSGRSAVTSFGLGKGRAG